VVLIRVRLVALLQPLRELLLTKCYQTRKKKEQLLHRSGRKTGAEIGLPTEFFIAHRVILWPSTNTSRPVTFRPRCLVFVLDQSQSGHSLWDGGSTHLTLVDLAWLVTLLRYKDSKTPSRVWTLEYRGQNPQNQVLK
jgi:hypothetical protein